MKVIIYVRRKNVHLENGNITNELMFNMCTRLVCFFGKGKEGNCAFIFEWNFSFFVLLWGNLSLFLYGISSFFAAEKQNKRFN
jgi:hypothetical protein